MKTYAEPDGPIDPLVGEPYPYLDMVFWTDEEGRQVIKWSAEKKATPLVDTSTRDYFSRIDREEAWMLRGADPPTEFYLQPVSSMTTGRRQAVFARPAPEAHSKLGVAAVITRLHSIIDPVLPPSFGFAVIDAAGSVRFHSNSRRSLLENFFDECEHEPALLANVAGRTAGRFSARYFGRDHSMYVKPLSGLPWSLVVFRARAPLRTARLEVLTEAVSATALLNAIFLLLFFVPWWLGGFETFIWYIWPHRASQSRYVIVLAAYVLLAIGFLSVVTQGSLDQVLAVTLLIPAIAFCCGALCIEPPYDAETQAGRLLLRSICKWAGWICVPLLALWLASSGPSWLVVFAALPFVALGMCLLAGPIEALAGRTPSVSKRLPDHRTGYALAATGVICLLNLLPTFGLFQICYRTEIELLVRHHQLGAAEALTGRAHRLTSQYRELLGAEDAAAFLERRLSLGTDARTPSEGVSAGEPWDVYLLSGSRARVSDGPPPDCVDANDSDWIKQGVARVRPPYNDQAVATRALLKGSPDDGSWGWYSCPGEGGEADLLLQMAGMGNRPSIELRSRVPSPGRPDAMAWGIVALFMGSIVWLVIKLERKSILDRVFEDRRHILPDRDMPVTGNMLILGLPFSSKTNIFDSRPDVYPVDVATVAREDGWSREAQEIGKASRDIVLLDHLDYAVKDEDTIPQLTSFLEDLIFKKKKKVVALSNVAPDFYFRHRGAGRDEDRGGHPAGGPRDRFTQIISGFEQRILEDPPQPEYREAANECLGKILLRKGNGSSFSIDQKRRVQILSLVIEASRLHAPLRRIALRTFGDLAGADCIVRQDVFYRFLNEARWYYRALWDSCSNDEKTILLQLAGGGIVQPRSAPIIRELQRKRLVLKKEYFTLVNNSFAVFVQDSIRPGDSSLVVPEADWTAAKHPAVLALVAGFVLIFINERETVVTIIEQIVSENNLIAVLPLLAPAVMRSFMGSRGAVGPSIPV